MILHTRAAKIILLMLAAWLLGCAVYVTITGWNAETPEVGLSSNQPPVPSTTPGSNPPITVTSSPTPSVPITPTSTPRTLPEPEMWASPPSNSVYLSPRSLGALPGQEVRIEVMANLTGSGISGVEFELAFSPAAFEVRDVSPGALLGASPLAGTDEKDNEAGTLRYALARKGLTEAGNTSGVLAVITLRALDTATAATYPLTLRSIELTDERFREITGFEVLSSSIEVPEP